MDRSKKPKSSNLASHRRFQLLDLNKSSSSLNMSTSSLRSIGEEARKGGGAVAVQASRRATTVRFAPPPLSSATKVSSGLVSHSQSQQALAMARPATASGARPGSASSGTRCRTPAGRLPEPAGPKAMRRSWGWTAAELDAKEAAASGNPVVSKVMAKTHSRSSSAPRRLPAEEKEKPLPKRGSKIMITSTSRTKTNLGTPPKTETQGSRSPPGVAAARTNMKAPNSVSLKNMDTVSPPPRKTSVATIGACWESLPSDLQNLGLEVMRYRDDAEAAAVEALHQSSAAETLLRCLSAFADLTSAVAELSPQQTVDEFLALHGALGAAVPRDDKGDGHAAAGAWLRAAVTTDLAHFSLLYSAASRSKSSGAASPTVSPASPPPPAQRAAPSGEAGAEESWMEAARRALGEQMRAWFLGHVERLLDGDVAGTLGQLKRVNDWLDAAVGLGPESDAVERVRKKIYGYLLDHVESAVVALNGGVAAARRK
ncbi:unnamed protein product [Miscanthus lutarioriparius]|uniref:DUF6857 domain-containing protein n=1 Tax=Miscanthus lutarioriparius TaxID=422564 RepID=A0A811QD59_9POAL|nr:unnamed protein product [Miscanthus lutarioriparius]